MHEPNEEMGWKTTVESPKDLSYILADLEWIWVNFRHMAL